MLTASQLERVRELLKTVGEFQVKNQNRVLTGDIDEKGLNQLVSYVDVESEKMLISELRSITPQATYLAEEGHSEVKDLKRVWIIDPIDGTTNYLYGHSKYAISIGFYLDTKPVYAAVYNPSDNELFEATPEMATLNGTKISVSNRATLSASLVATGFPYYTFGEVDNYLKTLGPLMKETKGIRRMGSAALDLVYTACGRFDAFYELNLSPWDVAAGAYIVQQAGGRVSDFKLSSHYRDFVFGNSILASNGLIHDSMQKIINDADL